ncbi:hypothetical protein IH824_17370, partial [candidate division KSB1 bacterium]|nr:hypothetical protein [candidate division KSB1 bacterium]
MAGGGRSFAGISLSVLNIDSVNVNVSAPFTLVNTGGQQATIVGTGVEGMIVTVIVDPDSIVSTTIL